METTSSDSLISSGSLDQAVADRIDVTVDRGQRRAQLVGDRHQELALSLLRRGEAGGHVSEPLGQLADLVLAVRGRHDDGVVARGDLVGRARQRQHGNRDPAGQPPGEQAGEHRTDRERGCQPDEQRCPLAGQGVLRRGDDDHAERLGVRLEPDGLGGGEERPLLARGDELEHDRLVEPTCLRRQRRDGHLHQP